MTAETLFAGRYRLERRLGVGGMATVQLGFDTRLERYVAVKLLAEHLAEDVNFVSRFRREALAVARLVHPNIVQVYDFGTDERSGRQYIAMEYVDGPSCADIVRELGRLAPGEAVDILTQACRGLHYAHRNGVVHRDVKPGNLLRSRDGGQVKLADFGIAKAAEQSDITKVGSVLGTAAYLAPEQARGRPAGPGSDVYALGVVAYQLLAGRLPFEAASLTELARQQEAGGPPQLHEVDREIPLGLSLAVDRALARDPEARYQDAAEMEQALADGLRGIVPEPTGATTPLDREDATRPLERTEATRPIAPQARRPQRLEPVDVAAPAPRRSRERAGTASPPARRPERRRSGAGRFFALLLVLLVVGGAAGAYLVADAGQRGVQLREQVEGDAQQAVQEIRDLIEDNVR